jgi:transcriptional regulator with XRE-family HTH domain
VPNRKARSPFKPLIPAEVGICARFRGARRQAGLSQAELAVRLGLSRDQVACIESRRVPLKFREGVKFCRELNISQVWLIEGKEHVHPYLPVRVYIPRGSRNLPFSQVYHTLLRPVIAERRRQCMLEAEEILSRPPADFPPEEQRRMLDHHVQWIESELQKMDDADRWYLLKALNISMCQILTERAGLADTSTGWEEDEEENERKVLTELPTSEIMGAMKSEPVFDLDKLLARIKAILSTSPRGTMKALAERLQVSQSRLSEWLNGKCLPDGQNALSLSEWVLNRGAATTKSATDVTASAARATQARKTSINENQDKDRNKR